MEKCGIQFSMAILWMMLCSALLATRATSQRIGLIRSAIAHSSEEVAIILRRKQRECRVEEKQIQFRSFLMNKPLDP